MTRRERLERKLERRRQWAESRRRKSESEFNKAGAIGDKIPLGQPILVGHHSEKRHRRDIGRIDRAMGKSVEHDKMAKHHDEKADGLERQLDNTIFTDDPDAVERLEERIAELEEQADLQNRINREYRKRKGEPGWALAAGVSPEKAEAMESACRRMMENAPYIKKPCDNTNLRANIRRLKKRLPEARVYAQVREGETRCAARGQEDRAAGRTLMIPEELVAWAACEKLIRPDADPDGPLATRYYRAYMEADDG
jgi:hypothetical protein